MTRDQLLEAIAEKAHEVRVAQKRYFADRGNRERLADSKRAERELDQLLGDFRKAQGGLDV